MIEERDYVAKNGNREKFEQYLEGIIERGI